MPLLAAWLAWARHQSPFSRGRPLLKSAEDAFCGVPVMTATALPEEGTRRVLTLAAARRLDGGASVSQRSRRHDLAD